MSEINGQTIDVYMLKINKLWMDRIDRARQPHWQTDKQQRQQQQQRQQNNSIKLIGYDFLGSSLSQRVENNNDSTKKHRTLLIYAFVCDSGRTI